jgi:large subunit ribosomal protein L30
VSLTVKKSEMAKIRITQVRSAIGRPKNQKATIVALGIKKMNSPVEKEATPQIIGMVRKIEHLVKVEEL